MLRSCPHCGSSGQIDSAALAEVTHALCTCAFAVCHACSGRYTVVRAGASELPTLLSAPAKKRSLNLLPRLRLGLNWVLAGAGAAVLIAAPASLLLNKARSQATSDVVRTSLAAPIAAPQSGNAPSIQVAEVDLPIAILRAGPGFQYRRLGSVTRGERLTVRSVGAEWVEILPPEAAQDAEKPPVHGYWIRKDLVRLSEDSR